MTSVDVIIPTYKPVREFRELLERLEAQTVRPGHILVINTEEALFDPELIRDLDNVEVFHITKEQFDHGGTRNMGAGFSNAGIIVFMTQDALPADEDLIRHLTAPFRRDERIKAAYARQCPRDDCSVIEKYTRRFNYPERSMVKTRRDMKQLGIKTFFCSNVCAAYDRAYFAEKGGFRQPSIFNEDMIFGGMLIADEQAIAYAASAVVYHSHNYTAIQQFRRNFDNGVSQAANPDIFKGVPSAGEGMRLVGQTARYLRTSKQLYLLPTLVWQSGWKFLGFRLGKLYRHLPRFLVRAFSLNKDFWNIKVTVD